MTREFCDRCDREIPRDTPRWLVRVLATTKAESGAPALEEKTALDAMCESCGRALLHWLRLPLAVEGRDVAKAATV